MNSRLTITLGFLGLLAAVGTAVVLPVLAHEGHGTAAAPTFDINAPRAVTPEAAALIGLKTAEIDFGEVVSVLRIAGIVRAQPDRVQALAPRIGGSIERIRARVGDRVKKGDAIVEIASPDYLKLLAEFVQVEGLLSQLRVEVDSSRERAAQAEAELKRVDENQDSVAANVLSEKRKAAITARAEIQQKTIEIQRAEADLVAKKKLVDVLRQGDGGTGVADGMLTLSAALDGVVTSRDAVVGQGIDAGRTVLEIADYSVVQVEGELPESLVSRLDPSHAYSVRIRQNADGDPIATGTVRFISPIVDEVKRTARVVIDADNPDGRLRDGMYVDAAIVLREEKSAVVVPTSAVLHDGPVAFVFIKDKDTFVKKDIHHGVEDDRVFEVLEGLAPGDVVVTHGAYSVMQIRPKLVVAAATKEPAKDAAPAANEHDADGHKH